MTDPPIERPERPAPARRAGSVVIVNTGDGKGKSTAAFGTALRAVATGWRVAVVQFVKSGEWKVGEEKICRDIGVDWYAAGDGFTWDSEDLDESRAKGVAAWEFARGLIDAGDHRLVVLDEATYVLVWGWVPVEEFVAAIQNRPDDVNVIVTGRDAPESLQTIADTVTEMRKVKHAFDTGVMARRGLEY